MKLKDWAYMDELKREGLRSKGMPGKCDYQKKRACLDLVTLPAHLCIIKAGSMCTQHALQYLLRRNRIN